MKRIFEIVSIFCLSSIWLALGSVEGSASRPNVLFIAVDDLNDWVGVMGGHSAALTPNIDRLAEEGTLFLNAHCQAPVCNPSRVSVLTGLRPTTTGVYTLKPNLRSVEALRHRPTLIQYFNTHGYRTMTAGKVDHGRFGDSPDLSAESDVFGPDGGPGDVFPPEKLVGPTPMGNNHWMDWGAFDHDESKKGDALITEWAVDTLGSHSREKPFFLSLGYFLPHVPAYVTPEWMEKIPKEGVLPEVLETDRADVPDFAWRLHWHLPEPRIGWLREKEQWTNLVRSYLASIAWVDSQIGRVLATLESEGFAENTIIVLWGDHGYHLGEKGISGKNSLWEESTRVPLIFAGPGVARGGRVSAPAELLDIFPSLVELAGLPVKEDLEGLSLGKQLRDAMAGRERPAVTTHNRGNHSVRSERYRYIRYADGSEEFYDHLVDPNEWRNLADDAAYEALILSHREWLPQDELPHAPGSKGRVLRYDEATGRVEWEGKLIPLGAAVPE